MQSSSQQRYKERDNRMSKRVFDRQKQNKAVKQNVLQCMLAI